MILSGRLSARLAVLCIALGAVVVHAAHADPVAINIVDVAGNLQLTQKAFEAFKAKNPQLVSNITFTNAPAPQLLPEQKSGKSAYRPQGNPGNTPNVHRATRSEAIASRSREALV